MTIDTQFQFIAAKHLSLSPLNVRKANSETGIEELATLIEAEGVLQNLDVYEADGGKGKSKTTHAVIAGGRRWRALQLLIKEKRLSPDYGVPCLIVSQERAIRISLAENSGRVPMHPADEFEAFKRLVDSGLSIEDAAASFGVAPIVVQRRLKLANVSPQLIDLYRDGKTTLEQLMALALTDDHQRQLQVWSELKGWQREPDNLRRVLTEGELPTRAPMARFVGLKAYTKAGGGVRRELFSEQNEGYITDTALLLKLAGEKLEREAQEIKKESPAWVEIKPTLEYSDLAAFRRVRQIPREPTDEERAKLENLAARRIEIEAEVAAAEDDEDRLAELDDRAEAVDVEEEEINEGRLIPDPEQAAAAGVLVSIDDQGKLRIERGLLKPEDAKRLARTAASAESSGGKPSEEEHKMHSEGLTRRLEAHRSMALRALLAGRTDLALVVVTHRLVLQIFFQFESDANAVEITIRSPSLVGYGLDVERCKAHAELSAEREFIEKQLPSEPGALFQWLLGRTQDEVLGLLAFCVAMSINGVTGKEGPSPLDELARAVDLDMRQWWTPTADTYLASVPKARVLEVLCEAVSAEAAAPLAKMKKTELVEAAERKLAETGWLPPFLRRAS